MEKKEKQKQSIEISLVVYFYIIVVSLSFYFFPTESALTFFSLFFVFILGFLSSNYYRWQREKKEKEKVEYNK